MGDLSGIIKQLITERERIDTAIATLQSLDGASAKQQLSEESQHWREEGWQPHSVHVGQR